MRTSTWARETAVEMREKFTYSFYLCLTAFSGIAGSVLGVAVVDGFSWPVLAVTVAGVLSLVSISLTMFFCAFVLRQQKEEGEWFPEEQDEELSYERAEFIEL